jgi:hypothetical protein
MWCSVSCIHRYKDTTVSVIFGVLQNREFLFTIAAVSVCFSRTSWPIVTAFVCAARAAWPHIGSYVYVIVVISPAFISCVRVICVVWEDFDLPYLCLWAVPGVTVSVTGWFLLAVIGLSLYGVTGIRIVLADI